MSDPGNAEEAVAEPDNLIMYIAIGVGILIFLMIVIYVLYRLYKWYFKPESTVAYYKRKVKSVKIIKLSDETNS